MCKASSCTVPKPYILHFKTTLATASLDPKHRASLENTFCLPYTQTLMYRPVTTQAVHVYREACQPLPVNHWYISAIKEGAIVWIQATVPQHLPLGSLIMRARKKAGMEPSMRKEAISLETERNTKLNFSNTFSSRKRYNE